MGLDRTLCNLIFTTPARLSNGRTLASSLEISYAKLVTLWTYTRTCSYDLLYTGLPAKVKWTYYAKHKQNITTTWDFSFQQPC